MKHASVFLLILVTLVVGCGAPTSSGTPTPMIIAQWSGDQGGTSSEGSREIRTAEAWRAFWQQTGREMPRELNLSREFAVAIFAGEKRTGGYSVEIVGVRSVEIVGVREQEGRLVLDYRVTAPPPDAMTTQALTSPWAIAVVPRTELPVTARNVGSANSRARSESPEGNRPGARRER